MINKFILGAVLDVHESLKKHSTLADMNDAIDSLQSLKNMTTNRQIKEGIVLYVNALKAARDAEDGAKYNRLSRAAGRAFAEYMRS